MHKPSPQAPKFARHRYSFFRTRYPHLFSHLKYHLSLKHHCLLCNEANKYRICSYCQNFLAKPIYSCQRCALPLKHFALFCGQCLKHPPAYDTVFSPYLYQAPLKQLLYDYKQKGYEYAGKALGDLFYQSIIQHYQQQHLPLPTLIAPVPLHWQDQWLRGFNQSEFFSCLLSKQLTIKHFDQIKRIKRTQPQKELNRKQRINSLRNSFIVKRGLQGESIAIIDDVMTTGATANTVATALKDSGAGQVTIWALARTLPRGF